MIDPFLTAALGRLDRWLVEIASREDARARRLTPNDARGWESVANLARPAAGDLACDGEPSEPLVPADEHALTRVAKAFGLAAVEAEVLLVLLAAHLEPRYRSVYAILQDNHLEPWVTERLLLVVLGRSVERRRALLDSLSASGRLIDSGLLVSPAGAYGPLARPFDLAPEVRGALLGLEPPTSVRRTAIERRSAPAISGAPAARFTIVFGPGEWVGEVERIASGSQGGMLVAAPPDGASAAALAGTLWRLGALHDALPVLDLTELEIGADRTIALEVERLVGAYGGRAVVLARQPLPIAAPQIPAPTLSFTDRRRAWLDEAARRGVTLSDGGANHLASTFRLGLRGIAQAFVGAATPDEAALAEAAARLTHVPIRHGIAVTTTRRFDDLVLRDTTREALERLIFYMKNRDRLAEERAIGPHFRLLHGPIALFAGQSGTGKTVAAEVVAHELGRPLYVVELSQLVSKYIGETEKNIEQVLAEAERAGVVLFFDEADALFSARTESVSNANDRNANLEVGYLLQRIERHEGLVILATNLRHAIDEAFLRRFQFRVEFPLPEARERLGIWERMIPARMPRAADLDLAVPAREHRLSGGEIRNVALKAVLLAEQQGAPLAQAHVERAVSTELLEMGRLARRPTTPEEARLPVDRGELLRRFVDALGRLLEDHLRSRFLKEIHVVHGPPTKEVLAGRRPSVSVALHRMTAPKAGGLRLGFVISAWSHRPVEEHELLGVAHDALWMKTLDSIDGRKATLRLQESHDFDTLHRFWSSHGHPVRASLLVDGEVG